MTDRKLCMIPGPIEFHEDVLAAMSTPATSHVDPKFVPVYGETLKMVRKVALSEKGQPFVVSGSCTLGWDMMVNLIEGGDQVLVLSTGYFSDNFADCLSTYGANITTIQANLGETPCMEKIKQALASTQFKMVTITHVDTSTGVLSDIESIARTVKSIQPECLVVVDAVCALGSEEIRFDDWQLDIVISGSQKGLGVPPGLSVVVASPLALRVYHERKTPVVAYYANWKKWLPIMQAYEEGRPAYFATPAVQLIYALHVSLSAILQQTVERRFELHRQVAQQFREKVRALGLETLAKDERCAANGMTAIWLPQGIEIPQLVPAMASKGVQIAGGILNGLAGKYFRIGHMGISVTEPERGHISKVVQVLTETLKELKQ
ncbi:pyridoxal phosphate-dependent transferase [Sporodiniella umbellata]|nr:pyridoxal phosphate-dependent transferase [Sporodiniella umbellata]